MDRMDKKGREKEKLLCVEGEEGTELLSHHVLSACPVPWLGMPASSSQTCTFSTVSASPCHCDTVIAATTC